VHDDSTRRSVFLGLNLRELWWPSAVAVIPLAVNTLVVHDGRSFFGGVPLIGFRLGVLGVHAVRLLRRAASTH
jgi:hypothetical protein